MLWALWAVPAELHSVRVHAVPPPVKSEFVEGPLARKVSTKWSTVGLTKQLVDNDPLLVIILAVHEVQNSILQVKTRRLKHYPAGNTSIVR